MTFTGCLRRNLPPAQTATSPLQRITDAFILVTTGGGGDGEAVIDWVLKAYEFDSDLPYPSLLVLGPFMQSERQAEFLARAARLPKVEVITFDSQQIGRASCRERVCQYVSISVVAVSLKTKDSDTDTKHSNINPTK